MADGSIPTIVRRPDALQVRAIRADSREVDFIASTETIDSYDEVIDQASWDLRRFDKNPIILYQHDRWSLPIGQATRYEVKNGQLECTVKFASAEANPQAEQVFKLVNEKVLRAVSVGFRPLNGYYELRDGRDVYVLYDCELREISVVTVPANEDCLAQMKSASLAELGVVTAAPGREAEAVRSASAPEMRERVRSAIVERDAGRGPGSTRTKPTSERGAPSLTTTEGAKSATEQDMDLKEATERLEKSEKSLVDAKVAEKAASDKAAAADAHAKAVEAERDKLTAANATLTSEHAKAATDRDAALARAKKAEGDLIALEVEQLVGKKIGPTEKDDFIKLRTESPELFTSMVTKRAEMKLTEPVIGGTKADPSGANGAAVPPVGADTSGDVWND